MYACMHVCVYVCMYNCRHVYMYVCMYVCLCMFVYVCVCLCFPCSLSCFCVLCILGGARFAEAGQRPPRGPPAEGVLPWQGATTPFWCAGHRSARAPKVLLNQWSSVPDNPLQTNAPMRVELEGTPFGNPEGPIQGATAGQSHVGSQPRRGSLTAYPGRIIVFL